MSTYQVVQPVQMSTQQDARTQAYLQHSMAPIAPTGVATAPQFGAFPAAGGMPALPSFYPSVSPSSVVAGVGGFAPMAMPAPGVVPPPSSNPLTTIAAAGTPGFGGGPSVTALPAATHTGVLDPAADTKTAGPLPPSTYRNLIEMIRDFGSRIPLPADDVRQFEVDFPLDPTVKTFVRGHALLDMLAMVEYTCRRAAQSAPTQPDPAAPISMVDVAKHVLNCLSAVNQLPGWLHAEKYIRNPMQYMENAQIVPVPDAPRATPAATVNGAIDELLATGTLLLKRLCQRINWVLHLQTKDQKTDADPDVYMRVISADRTWASDANLFMKDAEVKVTRMLTDNQAKFHAFRELQRKGVQWPHSAAARKDVESAGFVFRPMMIKRDRCICETCLVEVSGWRPWQCAWAYHDYSRHAPAFLEKARIACSQNRVVMMILDDAKQRLQVADSAQQRSIPPVPPAPVANEASGRSPAAGSTSGGALGRSNP